MLNKPPWATGIMSFEMRKSVTLENARFPVFPVVPMFGHLAHFGNVKRSQGRELGRCLEAFEVTVPLGNFNHSAIIRFAGVPEVTG